MHLIRKGEKEIVQAEFITHSYVADMSRPVYVTMEMHRFRYVFLFGLLFTETQNDSRLEDKLNVGVQVSAVLGTSIAETYAAATDMSKLLSFNLHNVYTLEQLVEIANDLPANDRVDMKFTHQTHLVATKEMLVKDDIRLQELYNMPTPGIVTDISK